MVARKDIQKVCSIGVRTGSRAGGEERCGRSRILLVWEAVWEKFPSCAGVVNTRDPIMGHAKENERIISAREQG